ncbi:protein transport protein bos1 [Coemansia sp. RSA 2706]|nr:protein transport protein bos1 [Coemansia sp. RSA 2711]KAJ1841802.1 protein transport protein bos1 [Coemansia sp. RSA 2708]KAJ2287028.1 protein transport protein bos1 [Coemansia sp. RSA 2706]KAJ2309118.1 protein transport protein bos1 [Coemansia sp. RSA 2705]KAJ2316477.1 protein transport protein bos1 [Coemansia sp. RSA 2704]KAJ2364911.1 protein transport protein bos1 [Coemansia sp. RSA 2610]KAJ2388819.1 protein transport protein bos1 [Coemansia sp. RSA 2611]KAJ2710441.1 protein transport
MTSEYNAAQRALHKLKQNVSDFDLLPSTQDSAVVEAAIAQDLQTLSKRISEYRLLGRQEVNERKRTMMLDRATSMADEHEQLKRRTDKIKQRRSGQQTYESERSELFQRDNGARVQMDTAIVMEDDFYARSEQQLDGYIAQGMASLQNLREQRGLLQSAHRRILNADATLGLSRGVIKLINRRTTQDKLILGGGMAVTCFFIYLIIHFLG